MRKVEEKGKYSLLEMILVFTIIALVLSTAIIPAMKRARESARKVNDIATAKAIYTTTYEGLLTDKIDYPDKDIFIGSWKLLQKFLQVLTLNIENLY